MDSYRREIEKIKRRAREEFEAYSKRFTRAIIRELGALARRYGEDPEKLIKAVEKYFNLPPGERNLIKEIVSRTQADIRNIWNDYFAIHGIGYEGVKVMEEINFNQLREDHRQAILNELKRGIKAGLNYKQIRINLIKRDIGAFHAITLANTAIAGYDNRYMHEICAQAGIEKFLYDGMPAQRPFCREHYKKAYTRAEIEMMDNGQGLDVLTYLGGYNCVHFWTPIL